jgi:hypothetical protein
MNGLLFFFTDFGRTLGVVIAGVAGASEGVIDGERGTVGVGVANGWADPDPLLAAAVGAGLASASR